MKKNKYIIIVLVALLIITGFLFLNEKRSEPKSFSNIKEVKNVENIKNISVYINVLDKNYSVKVEEGATALDVMKSAQNSGLSFNGKEYSGMGFFVDEINGIKGEKGKYWFYSINEKEAEIGLSKYVVKNGDIISWKLK